MSISVPSFLPKDFGKRDFMGSKFGSSETERIAENIVFIQKELNPNAWAPFTWGQYQSVCKHHVTESEKGVLEALVKGGKPVWNTTCVLEPGYLTKNDAGEYMVTDKFLEVIGKFSN